MDKMEESPQNATVETKVEKLSLDPVSTLLATYTGGSIELKQDAASGIAYLYINYPERKNALSGKMMVDLRLSIEKLEQWSEGRALIVYGANRFYCSGGDLNTVKQILATELGKQMSAYMQINLTKLQSLPIITVSLIQGKAIGGGAELITACDYRLATKDARIGFVHRKMGITTGWSGGTRLVRLLGRSKALELMLTCDQMNAEQAKEIGLVDQILDECEQEEQLLQKCRDWLQKRICGSVQTLQAIKRMITAAETLSFQDSLDTELRLLTSVWGQAAHQDALNANLKHRS